MKASQINQYFSVYIFLKINICLNNNNTLHYNILYNNIITTIKMQI